MKKIKLLLLCAIGGMMVACSNESDFNEDANKQEIKVSAGIHGLLTRAAQDPTLLQDQTFYDGSKFKLYLKKGSVGGANVEGTPSAGYFTVTKSSSGFSFDQKGYYPTDGSSVVAYAIYPYTVEKDQESFEVATNQSTDAAYRANDLMYAYKADNIQTSDPIQLNFKHCLAKVIVKVVADDGTTANSALNGYTVSTCDFYTTAKLDWSGTSLYAEADTDNGNFGSINLGTYNISNGLSALIPEQQYVPSNPLFTFTSGGNTYEYTPSAPIMFYEGYVYTFKLKLSKTSITGSYSTNTWEAEDDIEGTLTK